MTATERIAELAQPLLADAGLELWDVEVAASAVRLMVDRDGGVDLDALTAANAVISPLLDSRPDLAPKGPYQLEVSSPGLERSLKTPAHYTRYVGSAISVKTKAAVAGARRWRGRLLEVNETGIVLATEGAAGGEGAAEQGRGERRLAISFDQVDKARTVLEWEPAPKPRHRGQHPDRARARMPENECKDSA
ncbi:MAG: ribosome maturation factor RimP [Acidimicrobiales bacterium]